MEYKQDQEHSGSRLLQELREHNKERQCGMDIQDIKKWFKHKNVLFATNGDIVPRSPLLDSISTY